MRISWRVAALGLLLSEAVQAQTSPAGDAVLFKPAPAGSVQPWNGHDLTGWVSFFRPGAAKPVDFWTAKDGVLHLAKTAVPGYLRTEKSFAHYRLHVEWRWPAPAASVKNNSGIFVLQRPPDAVWPYSVQVQIKTNACGDLIAQGGLTFTPGNLQLTQKKLAPPNERPVGEWNVTEVVCQNSSIEVFVNGVRQNFVDHLPADSGQIALQMEGYPIEFRNFWLQPL